MIFSTKNLNVSIDIIKFIDNETNKTNMEMDREIDKNESIA